MSLDTPGKAPLHDARIRDLPSNAYYLPNFITSEEETYLIAQINSPNSRWHVLTHRRLQTHPSPLSPKNILLTPPHLPDWLTISPPILDRFAALGLFADTPHGAPNHVLINEYKPGQGIMPHEDGGAYAPVVATVSLGACLVLDLYDKKRDDPQELKHELRQPKWRILQEPRSLLVTTHIMYTDYLHGIAERDVDDNISPYREQDGKGIVNWELLGDPSEFLDGRSVRGIRTSLTYRDVLRVKETGKSLKFLTTTKK